MMQPLILVKNKNANKHAVDLGIAMQLTNIAEIFTKMQYESCIFT